MQMQCGKCNKVRDVFTTLYWCFPCISKHVENLSINRIDAVDPAAGGCANRHFMFGRKDATLPMMQGAFRHDVIRAWIPYHRDDPEHPTPISYYYENFLPTYPGVDPDGEQKAMLKRFAEWFMPPPNRLMLCVDGGEPFPYKPKFRAPFDDQSPDHVLRLGAIVLEGEPDELYLWQFAHDFVWWDENKFTIRIKDWKGIAEAYTRNQKIVLAYAAWKIWGKQLGAVGITFEAHALGSHWYDDDAWDAAALDGLHGELLAISRRYVNAKRAGDWARTPGKSCEGCPGFGRCAPANSEALVALPAPLVTLPLSDAPTNLVMEAVEPFTAKLKVAEQFKAALVAEAFVRVKREGMEEVDAKKKEKHKLAVGARIATAYMHPHRYGLSQPGLLAMAEECGIDPRDHQTVRLNGHARELGCRKLLAILTKLCEANNLDPDRCIDTTMDLAGLRDAIVASATGSEKMQLLERIGELETPESEHERLTWSNGTTTKAKKARAPKASKALPGEARKPDAVIDPPARSGEIPAGCAPSTLRCERCSTSKLAVYHSRDGVNTTVPIVDTGKEPYDEEANEQARRDEQDEAMGMPMDDGDVEDGLDADKHAPCPRSESPPPCRRCTTDVEMVYHYADGHDRHVGITTEELFEEPPGE